MGTKNNPGEFDCYHNAEPDEPMFILLARDPVAPAVVEKWIEYRGGLIALGIKPESDRAMLVEARQCLKAMEEWRAKNRPPLPAPSAMAHNGQEQPDFVYWECKECGFDAVTRVSLSADHPICPVCAGDTGRDVVLVGRTARTTDTKIEGKDARAALT